MTTEREELRKQLEYQLDSRTFNTQLHEDLIAFLASAQPQGEPVGIFRATGAWPGMIELIPHQGPPMRDGDPVYTSPPAQAVPEVNRDAILAEAARLVELIGLDWKEAGMQQKQYAAEYLRDQIRALSAAPHPGGNG